MAGRTEVSDLTIIRDISRHLDSKSEELLIKDYKKLLLQIAFLEKEKIMLIDGIAHASKFNVGDKVNVETEFGFRPNIIKHNTICVISEIWFSPKELRLKYKFNKVKSNESSANVSEPIDNFRISKMEKI